ncbi:MAG: ABC transporter ATP-binding protein [Anaerolineae bacterium]
MTTREFTVANEYGYDRRSPGRWVFSHIWRYAVLPVGMVITSIVANWLLSYMWVLIGQAFTWVSGPDPQLPELRRITLSVVVISLGQGIVTLARNGAGEWLAQRLERDSRDELYISLLGKSLTFHGRQRVGDLLARATNDVRQINLLASPSLRLIIDSITGIVVPIFIIATLRLDLVVAPTLFVFALIPAVWKYTQRLNPVSDALRAQLGVVNAGLNETITGIEVVKANAQEKQEQARFGEHIARLRDYYVQSGDIQARYLPLLIFSGMYAVALLHALLIYGRGGLDVGQIITFLGLVSRLRQPTFFSLWTFTQFQMALSSAARILQVLNAETELGENVQGVRKTMQGAVEFENVTFGYNGSAPVLRGISFRADPGETIAIVGQTGSGKTTLTRLINRVYDVTEGRVLVDGTDVREWNLESLRSQISAIEQDVFLFSRSIAENIAFGVGQQAEQELIERYAGEAQAHTFIGELPDGYDTVIGERGVTLSGGQRQRLAIARAFLTNPRILILDDSTSAIDSATEDEIQKAMNRVKQGRTTFLITHRLSQIRWADRILVLRRGELVDQGTHEELLRRSETYRRIFDVAEP